jgi:hypothetical protein
VHGLLDAFLAFNPTAWLFWLLLGFAAISQDGGTGRRSDTDQKPQVSGR